MYVQRRRGMGADCAYEGDPTCETPTVVTPSTPCYPLSFMGPLPAGSVYCSAGAVPAPASAGCPAGSTCTIFAGVPNTGVYAAAAIFGSLILFGVMHK